MPQTRQSAQRTRQQPEPRIVTPELIEEWLTTPPGVLEEITPQEILSVITDVFLCDNCTEERDIHGSRLVNNAHGSHERWCNGCVQRASTVCVDCNQICDLSYTHEDYPDCCRQCGEQRLEEAREYEEDDDDYLSDYSARIRTPMSEWPGYPAKNKRYFGVELEVELKAGESRPEKVDESKSLFPDYLTLFKNDGSLNYGFEIVGAPTTLEKVDHIWKEFLQNTPSGIRSQRTETCGMHVHVSRKSMSPLTLGKALVFVNSSNNVDFISLIAGRRECSYCQRKPKTIQEAQVSRSDDRYELLNITEQTAEFRMFKGTLTYKTFMKNVEFCDALVEFCSQASMKGLTESNFKTWLKDQSRMKYPHLKKFIFPRKKGAK